MAERWEIGPRTARYRVVPANDAERAALERIGHTEFEAISIGRFHNGPQVAIVPMDESSREIAQHIVDLHNASIEASSTQAAATVEIVGRAILDELAMLGDADVNAGIGALEGGRGISLAHLLGVAAFRAIGRRPDPRLATGTDLDALVGKHGEKRHPGEPDADLRARVFPEVG